MAYTQIPMLPEPPKVEDGESEFDAKAFNWTLALDSWTESVNAAGSETSSNANAADRRATDANRSARDAESARDTAKEYRNSAAQSGNIVANVQDGLAGGTDYFTVAGKEAMTLYRNEGGEAVEVLEYPSNATVQDNAKRVAALPDPLLTSLLF